MNRSIFNSFLNRIRFVVLPIFILFSFHITAQVGSGNLLIKCNSGLGVELLPVDTNGDGEPDSGTALVSASVLDAGTIDLNGPVAKLQFSFSKDPLDNTRTYTCADRGVHVVELWATNILGNQAHCETYVIVQDKENACNMPSSPNVGGRVVTTDAAGKGVEGVIVSIKSPTQPEKIVITDSHGRYEAELPLNNAYTIQATHDVNPQNGLSTIDIVLIQKHLLNVQPLNSIRKIIAADVNNSATITAADLVEERKLILGKIPKFSKSPSWKIVVDNGAMQVPQIELFRTIDDLTGDRLQEDFVGIKIGDVNGSAKANGSFVSTEGRSGQALVLQLTEQAIVAGQTYSVPFRSSNFEAISGFQFTLNFDRNALAFANIEAGKLAMSDDNFGLTMLDKGWITSSWNEIEGVGVAADDVLFTVNFTAKSDGKLSNMLHMSSDFTPVEAYNSSDDLMNLTLKFENTNEAYELYQNVPNPVLNSTIIGFNLPEQMAGKLTIYDLRGKVLKTVQQTFNKGNNQINFTRPELASAGLLYYTLETADFTATKKMILIE